jgi:hypothetical protein
MRKSDLTQPLSKLGTLLPKHLTIFGSLNCSILYFWGENWLILDITPHAGYGLLFSASHAGAMSWGSKFLKFQMLDHALFRLGRMGKLIEFYI